MLYSRHYHRTGILAHENDTMTDRSYDITIVGGGIIGLASAMELSHRYPRYKVGLVEKEKELATHQTGHNSGVIHSGIYYKPGSLKARNCVSGARELMAFCDKQGIQYELCGKVVVATTPEEVPALEELYRRGTANGVHSLEMVGRERLRELEPHANGVRALWSPNTGIVDFTEVAAAYAAQFRDSGGEVRTGVKVLGVREADNSLYINTTDGDYHTRFAINCAGLYADAVARMMGAADDLRIIPFRGEYYTLSPDVADLVRGLIYPVPDPQFPFLGVHFTKTIHKGTEAGPNAVLAFAKEGYRMTSVDAVELYETLSYKGFWAMSAKYWKTGMMEFYRSLSKGAFARALQRLVPEVRRQDLIRGGAGVRAQAVGSDGRLADDFHISETANAIHILNAPSPAATASLAIGRHIVDRAEKSFRLVA